MTEPGAEHILKLILEPLRSHDTIQALAHSSFFREHGPRIEAFLQNAEVCHNSRSVPHLDGFVRAAQWNIEKGISYAAIVDLFRSHKVLQHADIILLNEADCGMLRSGNRHVARCLAQALQMNFAFAPAHFELTKGTGADLQIEGDNRESLQGNAILTRFPILQAKVISLPQCFEPYEFEEKRYGRRNCLWIQVQIGSHSVWIASTHLEVRNTPTCRARQMTYILSNLPGQVDACFLLGGDLNSNGFSRGTFWRTLCSVWRLLSQSPQNLKEQLRHPEEHDTEPLFRALHDSGFLWEGLNSDEDTASASIADFEDARFLPDFLVRRIQRRLEPHQGYLHFKLDWFFSKGFQPLDSGERVDRHTGVVSSSPGCVQTPRTGPGRISDHIPIYVDLRLP